MRREREVSAARLRERVPRLERLELLIRHDRDGHPCPEPSYVRRIPVATGPAIFWVPCSHADCTNGGHDITTFVMRALYAEQTHFEGSNRCMGQLGNMDCQRFLIYTGRASYSPRRDELLVSSRSHA